EWGYLPATLALGLAALYVLGLERVVVSVASGAPLRYAIWTAAAGIAVAWLQPWEGLTLLVVTVALAAWDRFDRRHVLLVIPAAGVLLPLVYYAMLARRDPAWGLGQLQANYDADRPLWALVVALA